jgi:DNA gyrase/topoisomerase IV subunit A
MDREQEQIIRTEYSELMQKSYIDYAMSVIVSRALPDVRDGLKPVQRRTLYDMYELGIRYDRPYRKCARIVGDTMGKYHPHGDSSIYESLVVMAQDFKKGLPLVDGHGNFGSIEGDGAAAMRYTEARLQKVTQDAFLSDLDKDVVDFGPNFDETEKEPQVLPVRLPNLLVNGSEGIAVGMVTSTPPHNLGEVIDAVKATILNHKITTEELMQYIQGPDFPTGGIVINKDDLLSVYETGTGKIRLRGRVEIEKLKGGKERIVITEIPYTMMGANIGKFLNDIAGLVENKTTTDIVDISNQSSKDGIRIVLELRKNADTQNIINMLYKKTRLEDTFGVNMLAVANGKPETLGLKAIIEHHIDFQFELATRKYKNLLGKEKAKQEIQEGLIKACDVIDLIIEILRGSKNREQVKKCLVEGITEGIRFRTKASEKAAAVIILGIIFSSLTQTVALALEFINFILTVVSSAVIAVSGFFGDRFFHHCGTAAHTASLISSAGWSLTVISASLTLISGVIIAVTETSASILTVSSWASLLTCAVLTVVSASLTLISGVIITVTETSASVLTVSSWSSLLTCTVLTVVSASLALISGVIIAVTETSASILAVSSWASLLTCAVLTVTILCLTILSIILLAVVSASLLSFCSIL